MGVGVAVRSHECTSRKMRQVESRSSHRSGRIMSHMWQADSPRTSYRQLLSRVLAVLVLVVTTAAQTELPKRVPPADADNHIIHRVEPTVPPLATAARVGGKVKLHVLISASGNVSTVTVISGQAIRLYLECYPHAELRREWNSNSRTGTEEISQAAGGDLELLQAGDGHRC
jgi:hypothetical protein